MNEAPGKRNQSTTQQQHGHAQSAHIQGQPRRTIQDERRLTNTTGVDASAAVSKVQPERTVTVRVERRANRTNEPAHGTQRSKQSVKSTSRPNFTTAVWTFTAEYAELANRADTIEAQQRNRSVSRRSDNGTGQGEGAVSE